MAHSVVEIMDLTKVSSTCPPPPCPNIRRENMVTTLVEMLKSDTEIVVVEGPDGMGKTTLLAQFAREFPNHAFTLFVRSSSRWAYDADLLTRNLCDQIGWVLSKENYKTSTTDLDPSQLYRQRLLDLQYRANHERAIYYFVVDGLSEIPEEDRHERESLLRLLPFGLRHLRFVISGPAEFLKKDAGRFGVLNTFRLPGFGMEETREFFAGLVADPDTLKTIHRVSKMVPGNLASVRRLLQAGEKVEQLVDELPARLPDLFELEWRVVEPNDAILRQALAILAFDRRRHSIDSLCHLCNAPSAELDQRLARCTFVERRDSGKTVEFVCEVFKRFASERLALMRRGTLDLIITDLLKLPESSDALTHLPGYLHQAERFGELLTYLSPAHIGQLIECGESWIPLHQKTDLGVDTAFREHRDGDLLRFGLQRATITSIETSDPWRSEIEAYVAMDDFPAAYALVQRMVAKEDRLHLLAVIAREKKSRNLPVEPELGEQIQQLYRQLDKRGLGDRGIEIASDLLYTFPELAIELVQECMPDGGPADGLDMALVRLSFKALAEQAPGMGMESTQQALRAKVKDPDLQRFFDTVTFYFGGYNAEGVVAEVEKWENAADRVLVLSAWAAANATREDAGTVVEYALDTILKTTTYTANAKVYSQLAMPLVHVPNVAFVFRMIDRLDGLKGIIEGAGPTQEYVKLQATLAEAEARVDLPAAGSRLQDLYFYVDAIKEPSNKLSALAVLTHVLRKVDREGKIEGGIHQEVTKSFKTVVDMILTKTADHYDAVRRAIGALARSDNAAALEVIAKLNTGPRREAALVRFVEAIASDQPSSASFNAIANAYGKIKNVSVRTQATTGILKGLSSQRKELAPYVNRLVALREWAEEIPDAEDRCKALSGLIRLLLDHKDTVPAGLMEQLVQKLGGAWETVDLGWTKIGLGFEIVALMAKCCPDISRDFLKKTEQARREIILDSEDVASTYIGCVRLAIRCFAGLIQRQQFKEGDIVHLQDLIDRIPAAAIRVLAWAEVALRFYNAEDHKHCQAIVNQRVRPALESGSISDKEGLWNAMVLAAPALYCAHPLSARQLLNTLPEHYRDDAFRSVCVFLTTKRLPMETYDAAHKAEGRLNYTEFLDIYEVLKLLISDVATYVQMEALVDAITKDRNAFNKVQLADMAKKLRELAASKFPNPNFIQHEGYLILAEAQIARLERDRMALDALAVRARAIPNVADNAFVLIGIAGALHSKEHTKAVTLLQEARGLIPQIATLEDRVERYHTLAQVAFDIDRSLSRECIRQAWQETAPLNPDELPKARRKLIDFAYRLDPELAASLASETDADPGRELARAAVRERLDLLKLQERVGAGGDKPADSEEDLQQKVGLCRMLLAGLNSGRIETIHIERTRDFVKLASKLSVSDAYVVLAWVIENAVRRYSDTDQAGSLLRSLYDAATLSAELAFRIAARTRSVTEKGISAARSSEAPRELIRAGERQKALAVLAEWASAATGFIKITDPYFGLEELDMIKLIRGVNTSIPIFVLTSRKHQQDQKVQQPWDESYQAHWRMQVSDSDPGQVSIVIVGKESTSDHPIHDRWWLSARTGLRIGTSANSLGGGKLSEISQLQESEVTARLEEVDRYLAGSVRDLGCDKLKYLTFGL